MSTVVTASVSWSVSPTSKGKTAEKSPPPGLINTLTPLRLSGVVGFSLKPTTRSGKVSPSMSAEAMLVMVWGAKPMGEGDRFTPVIELR